MDIQIPSNTYIGRNVVRLHLSEFLELSASRNLLAADEKVLAVFDCIIMETGGIRLGGLTLHDYAIITNKHLITWARGRSKDVLDKFIWSYLTIESTRQRNTIEGMLKLVYKAPPTSARRRISLRAKDDSLDKASDEDVSTVEGVEVFLDYMPIEEVPVCQKMLTHFFQKEQPAANFATTFSAELEESTIRLTTLPAVLRPLYKQQANGVYVEVTDLDEARLLRASQPPAYYNHNSGKKGYASPYQLRREEPTAAPEQGKTSNYKSANHTSSATPPSNLSKLDSLDWTKPLPASGYGIRQAPKPEQPKPVEKPVAPPPPVVRNEPQQVVVPNGAVAAPGPTPSADTSSIYSVSRIAHGLLEGRQNFGRSMSDLGETATILANLPGLFSDDMKSKQAALMKLRGIFESGYLENNKLLNNALIPLLQPIINRFSPSEPEPVEQTKRINLLEKGASRIQRLTPTRQEPEEEAPKPKESLPVVEPPAPQPESAPEPKRIKLGKRS